MQSEIRSRFQALQPFVFHAVNVLPDFLLKLRKKDQKQTVKFGEKWNFMKGSLKWRYLTKRRPAGIHSNI